MFSKKTGKENMNEKFQAQCEAFKNKKQKNWRVKFEIDEEDER